MDSPGSDDERLRQESQAALSKKMKILIIMLSLVLMILLLPIASNHGLPLLRPMGVSLLQRLWDAMRFIAMTAAISVGIISTSNSHKSNKNNDGSSHYRSSSSFRRPSTAPIASSSGEAFNPNIAKYNNNNLDRSGSFSRHVQHIPRGEDGDDDYEWKGTQKGNSQRSKGKELMNGSPSSVSTYSDIQFDSSDSISDSVQSQGESFEGEEYEGFKHRPLKLSMINRSRRQWSAGDAWFLASRIDEEVEEDSMASAGYGLASGRSHGGESSMSKVDLQKTSLASHGKEGLRKEEKSEEKGLINVYNTMTDDNYAELKMRKNAVSRFAEEYQYDQGKGRRRSSSVDRRRPSYIYDQKSPDQPGLKQILMEMSKERASKFKMSDPETSGNQTNQRVLERLTHGHGHGHVQISSDPSAVASNSSVKQSMKANVQHHQASVVSTVKVPLDSTEKHVDVKIIENNHKQQEAMKMGSNENFQREANAKPALNLNMQQKKTDHSQIRLMPKQVDAAKVDNAQQNMRTEVDSKAKMSYPRKQLDEKMGSTKKTLNAKESNPLLQTENTAEIAFKGANMQRQHGSGEGRPQSVLYKDNVSSTSRLLKQSSLHSRSALNLQQLTQADQTKQQNRPPAGPSARGRKSFSYDFGDGFNPDWLMELEPPPPPGLIGSSTEQDQHSSLSTSNSEVKGTDNSFLVQSLVPWRSSAPIDISAYPRAASPLEMLPSQATGPSPGEVNRRADEFISNFTSKLMKQRQESLEKQKRYNG